MNITGKVLNPKYWVKTNGIKIDHFVNVTCFLQSLGESLENGVAK